MKFYNVIDWFNYIKKTPLNELQLILNEDFCLEEKLKNTEVLYIEKSLMNFVIQKLKGVAIENIFWENTLFFVSIDSLEDDVLNYFVKFNIAHEILGHLPLPDKYLWELANEVEEAILTLGKRYYTNPNYSDKEFELMLDKFTNSYWLWSSLLQINDYDINKRKILIRMLFSKTNFDDLKKLVIDDNKEKYLSKTLNIELLKEYFEKHRFLKAIAKNPNTPYDILIKLRDINNVKYAQQIRNYAKENLKKRNLPNK